MVSLQYIFPDAGLPANLPASDENALILRVSPDFPVRTKEAGSVSPVRTDQTYGPMAVFLEYSVYLEGVFTKGL